MLAGPLSHFQNGRKTHARLERPLLLRAGRPERRLRARRPGAGHTQVATEPAHRAAGGKAGRAPDPALDPQLRGHGTRPGILRAVPVHAGRRRGRPGSHRPHPRRAARHHPPERAAGADPLFPGRADRALHGQVPEGAGLPEELQPSGGRAARGLRPGRAGTLRTHRKQRPGHEAAGHQRPAPGRRARAGARRGAARRPERARPAADAGAGHRRTRKPLEAGRAGRRPPERALLPAW